MKKNQRGHFPPGKLRKHPFCLTLSVVVLLSSIGGSFASTNNAPQKNVNVSYDKVAIVDNLATIALHTTQQAPVQILKGIVRDTDGKPIVGASVLIKGTSAGTKTDVNGAYSISITNPENTRLVFTSLGKKNVEIIFSGQKELNVTLTNETIAIDEVIVTGVFNRPQESFTGAATKITTDQLRSSSSQGLINAISNVEPTFKLVRSNVYGSDPNQLAANQITMRGPTTLVDYQADLESAVKANMPLFIIDRFEASLEDFVALNEDRVENIVLLKDASATALYGSKASNGVLVITTRQPEQGKLRLRYTGDLAFRTPDLSTYNLMNASEKLQYELDAGLYDGDTLLDNISQMGLYHSRMLDVARGVNTDWLHYPVRVGVINTHSLTAEGGEGAIRYSMNVYNKNEQGVMKGSGRNTFAGNMYFHYNFKQLAFSNNLKITNIYAPNSNYGSFDRYAKMNAYWSPYDDDGNLVQILDGNAYSVFGRGDNSPGLASAVRKNSRNPLWDAALTNKNEEKSTKIQNDFQAEWFINSDLILRGGFSVSYLTGRQDIFKSPDHTDFSDYSGEQLNRKGTYYYKSREAFDLTGSLTLSYNHIFDTKHVVNAGVSGEIYSGTSEWYSFLAEGILINDYDFAAAASQFEEDGKPGGSESLVRRLSMRSFVNYMFDSRYFADASFALDGSSQFGTNKQFAPFFSVGLGWNIHNERFMSDQRVLNHARIKASYGVTGSVNFSPYDSRRMYDIYRSANYKGGAGMVLSSLGNSDLGWQTTNSYNLGLSLELFESFITLNADLYERVTNDLVAAINIPTASGLNTYKANIGKVSNKGFEVDLGVRIINNAEKNLRWTLTGTVRQNKNKVLKISDNLDAFNSEKLESQSAKRNPVFLFKEGESMNTIFAVKSKGIDPSTGKEIFVKLDGTETFTWNKDDLVACGVAEPVAWGTINSSVRWKGFILDLYFDYTTGAHQYNSTLADRVENIYPYMNADRHAMTDRWKNSGDYTRFKSIKEFNNTDLTSRFVMKDNTFRLSTVSLRYAVPSQWSMEHLGISQVELRGSVEDVIYISSIERERGTSFPFSNFFSFGLKLTF